MNSTYLIENGGLPSFLGNQKALTAALAVSCLVATGLALGARAVRPEPKGFIGRAVDSVVGNRRDTVRERQAVLMGWTATSAALAGGAFGWMLVASRTRAKAGRSASTPKHEQPVHAGFSSTSAPIPTSSPKPTPAPKPAAAPMASDGPAVSARSTQQPRLILDGTNICHSFVLDTRFHLESLLVMATELVRRGIAIECYFDASTRYHAARRGNNAQFEAYRDLLRKHPTLFREVPAGEPADDTVLMRADSEKCGVVSNDRFAKEADGHLAKYPWLKVSGRHVHGRIYNGRLVATRMGIDVAVPCDLDAAIKAFDAALLASAS